MRKLPIILGTLAALAAPALAADDPIAVRQALMENNGAAAGLAGAVMKGELDYDPVIGRAAIAAMHATGEAIGDFFPEGSADPERSRAAPRIWDDMAGFQAELEEFRAAAASAAEASGDDGPADAEAFTAAVRPVLETCRSCHETYRLED
jgi:cytochrome c556